MLLLFASATCAGFTRASTAAGMGPGNSNSYSGNESGESEPCQSFLEFLDFHVFSSHIKDLVQCRDCSQATSATHGRNQYLTTYHFSPTTFIN